MLKRERRLVQGEVDQAALGLIARHGPQILSTARRYAATPEDAEDAYQRAFEILLTKAPTTREDELVPWLKTVVKHEAFALRRQRERHSPITDDGELGDRGTPAAATHDQAERMERLRQGAEALRRLKPQEMRALLLKAEGYSYAEIGEITGWSYTKVNRCLTEGRRALSVRLAGIEGGVECGRFIPLLSALADGEARAEDLALLRPHMKTCLACRAQLKEFRAVPARVAALVPPVALSAGDGGGRLRGAFDSVIAGAQQKAEAALGAAQHKAAALGDRAHTAIELASGQKIAAIAASAAALAGGGSAVDHFARDSRRAPPPAKQTVQPKPVKEEIAAEPAPKPVLPVVEQPAATEPEPAPAPAPEPAPAPPPPPPPPDPAKEFSPVAPAPAPSPQPAPAPEPATTAFAPSGSGGGGGGSGSSTGSAGSEFAP
jgi:RNA polymerase sigma factor (sigma-70 family)